MGNEIHEECGVFGVFSKENQDVASLTYYGLFSLQHRGQESAGIVVNDDGVFSVHKDVGLVQDVFDESSLASLGLGNMAIGHVRYGTTGGKGRVNAQPIVVNHMKGNMALAHNGNLVNSYELRCELENNGSIFHTTSDTEVISYIITRERLTCGSIEQAVMRAMNKIEGAYSLIVMSARKLIAARDVHGFRPLCYGVTADGTYIVASETCALDSVGAKKIRDIEPGEVLVFTDEGIKNYKVGSAKKTLCVFEYLYFARPDSVIDGICVHEARQRAGELLADSYKIDADVVIGVPDSGLDAALGYSKKSGVPYGIGFIKNKYIGRTFISPSQKARAEMVDIKLNAVKSVVEGKKVILIDDSIVRGTTCAKIIKKLRLAGAKEVHMLSSAPAFTFPCYYGIDIDSKENLIACKHTPEETAKIIGADSLGYLSVDDAKKISGSEVCVACFNGDYPTSTPGKTGKNRFEQRISESVEKR